MITTQPQDHCQQDQCQQDQRKSEPDVRIRLTAIELTWNSKEVGKDYKPLTEALKLALQESFSQKPRQLPVKVQHAQPLNQAWTAEEELLKKPVWQREEGSTAAPSSHAAPGAKT